MRDDLAQCTLGLKLAADVEHCGAPRRCTYLDMSEGLLDFTTANIVKHLRRR